MFRQLNLLSGYKNRGLFQTTAFKKFPCPFYVFFIRNKDKWDIIFKSKDKKVREWLYAKHGEYKIVYSTDCNFKAFLTIEYDKNKVNVVKRDKLYNTKYLSTTDGYVIGGTWNIVYGNNLEINDYKKIISNDNKYYNAHRLIAHAFCPRPEHLKDVPYEDLLVNHIDGIKSNNHPKNLEWCTQQENAIHARDTGLSASGETTYNAALTAAEVKEIREDYVVNLRPYKYYIDKYNVKFDVIQALLNNITYYDPKYIVPEFVGKRKMTFADATWVRKHKQENLKTTLQWYADKFGVDITTIGKILQNILHPDQTYDPRSVERPKPSEEHKAEIIAHKTEFPSTPLNYYEKKYGYSQSDVWQIYKKHFKTQPNPQT